MRQKDPKSREIIEDEFGEPKKTNSAQTRYLSKSNRRGDFEGGYEPQKQARYSAESKRNKDSKPDQ